MMGPVEMPSTVGGNEEARRLPRPTFPPFSRSLTRRLHIDLLRVCTAGSPAV